MNDWSRNMELECVDNCDSSLLEPIIAAVNARAAGWREALEPGPGLTAARIDAWSRALADHHAEDRPSDGTDGTRDPRDEAELLERIASAERLKAAASARQAKDAVRLAALVAARQAKAADERTDASESVGLPRDPSFDVGTQIALARQEPPSKGGQLLGLARTLVKEMPHTLNALAAGRINEWRATLVVRETACLSLEDRVRVDEAMVPVYAQEGVGDRRLVAEARTAAQRLDPAAAVKRARKAVGERRVSVRPAPDSMAYLTCLLPAAQAISAYKALSAHADGLRASGNTAGPAGSQLVAPSREGARTRDQIMADTLVERLTGQARAGDTRLEVQLLISDAALLGGSAEPAVLSGYGVVPAQIARDLVAGSAQDGAVRRLYAAPATGDLVAIESKARIFPAALKRLIAARDRTCRSPWCDAPLRQYDHVVPAARGGPTSAANGQGLCERCNQTKESPGWSHGTIPASRHTVEVRTPAGETYRSTAPPLPGTREILYHRVEFAGGEYVFHTAA